MVLEGANKLKEDSVYTLYATNSPTAGQYCVIIPNNIENTSNMLVDLHKKTLFDEVSNGTKTKDDLANVLEEEYNKIKESYPYGILIVPMMKEEEYTNAVNTLDKQKMFDETKKIGAITSELYKKLTEGGIEKQKINQKIIIIEKEEVDTKYVNWLKEQMPNYVEGISLEPKKEETIKPEENNIFGMPTTQPTETEPVAQITIPPVTPTTESPTASNDIFGATQQTQSTPSIPVQGPEIENQPETQQPAPLQETPSPISVPPVSEQPAEIKPVESKDLSDATMTFSAIPNNPQETVEKENTDQDNTGQNGTSKKSGGFVNIAIILAVLIVVTIISIELGKYLYSVYGA